MLHRQPLIDAILQVKIANPDAALKKVSVIEKAMTSIGNFAGTVQKLTGMGLKSADISAAIAEVSMGLTGAIEYNDTTYSLADVFMALENFEPKKSELTKLDGVISMVRKMSSFASAVSPLIKEAARLEKAANMKDRTDFLQK